MSTLADYLARMTSEDLEREARARAADAAIVAPALGPARAALDELETLAAEYEPQLRDRQQQLADPQLCRVEELRMVTRGAQQWVSIGAGQLENRVALRQTIARAAQPIVRYGALSARQAAEGLRDSLRMLTESPAVFRDAWMKIQDSWTAIEATLAKPVHVTPSATATSWSPPTATAPRVRGDFDPLEG